MATETIHYRFLVRGGTAANLATVNEVPKARELVVETDTRKLKLGDGVTPYNDLEYITTGGGGGGSGDPPEFRATATHIQWRLVTDPPSEWVDLVPLDDLRGPAGNDGREVELGVDATHISWRYVGDAVWVDLVALADLKGADGRSVQLQKSASHIQWRLVGDLAWSDLVPLSDLQGEPGADAVGAATRATVVASTGTSSLAVGRVALLLAIECDAPARVRLYATAAARGADAGRTAGTAAPQGAGLLLEFIATVGLPGAPLTPGVVAYNLDGPTAPVIYANVQPTGGSASASITYLKLEA